MIGTRMAPACLALSLVTPAPAQAGESTFVYQGRLKVDGTLINGLCDLTFTLYDAPTLGSIVGEPNVFGAPCGGGQPTLPPIQVSKGLLTALLDFGPGAFDGGERWLEISVRCPAGVGACVTLGQRQPVTQTPYAAHAFALEGWILSDGAAFLPDGGLGIGVDSLPPGVDLHVFDQLTTSTSNVRFEANHTVNLELIADSDSTLGGPYTSTMQTNAGNGQWSVFTGGVRRLIINPTGEVGIGTMAIESLLHVESSASADVLVRSTLSDADLILDSNTGFGSEVQFSRGGASKWRLVSESSIDTFIFRNQAGNSLLHLTQAGGVGIDIAPAFQLQLSQNSAAKPGGGEWTNPSSDRRWKKNIRTLEGSLDRLLELRGVTYEFIEPARHGNLQGPQVGFIAQEVEPVFPDWVGTYDDGYRHLTVRGFEALTVEALRDLRREKDEEIAALERTVDAQERTIDELSQQVADLRRMILGEGARR
jgi:hypothetical protein